MSTPLLEAYDLVAHAEQLEKRLGAASEELAKRPGLTHEKAWIEIALTRVTAARDGIGDLPIRALRVPELASMKGDYAKVLQGAVVDALERVHGAIVAAGGARAPLLEALYYKLKIPALRKCDRDEFEKFCVDFDKRLKSTFARRILADPDYAVVAPALDGFHGTVATWRGIFLAAPLSDEEAQPLRDELAGLARRLDVPCRQARLLAQAALVPLRLLDDHGVSQRPKRRGPKAPGELDDDTNALLEQDPPDPRAPTPEEREELEELDAGTTPVS
jgi:hypothetical protein